MHLCEQNEQGRESFDRCQLKLRIFSSLIHGGHIATTYCYSKPISFGAMYYATNM